jgi:hypothetical protein
LMSRPVALNRAYSSSPKDKVVFIYSLILLIFLPVVSVAEEKYKGNPKEFLSFAKVKHYLISIESQLAGVVPQGSLVWTFVRKGNIYVESRYQEHAKDPDLGFGTPRNPLEGSERINLAEGEKDRRIRGALVDEKAHLFVDSSKRQVLHWDVERKRWLPPIDIVLDMMRPPADNRGEAPSREIQRTRRRFLEEYRTLAKEPEFILGVSPIPKYWKDQDGSQFLLLLRHKTYPLATLACQISPVRSCRIQRICYLPPLSPHEVMSLAGLAARAKTKEILIGLNDPPRILRYSAASCLSLRKISEDFLAPELRVLSGLAVDEKDRLWITTSEADLMHSASLFVWDLSGDKRDIPQKH